MSTNQAAVTDAPGGVPLPQFAAVNAAVAEEFALSEVLAVEEIDASAWTAADLAWTERLCGDTAGTGDLFAAYARELAAAEDRLARKVTPLDDDVAAWVGLVEALGASAAPSALVQGLGLRMNDMARLERRWARRAGSDPAVGKQIAEIKKKGPAPLPRVTAEPAKLRRSTGATKVASPSVRPPAAADPGAHDPLVEETGLDRYAAMCAELSVFSGEDARIQAKYGLPTTEARAAIERAFREAMEKDPTLERDFKRLHALALERASAALRARKDGRPAEEAAPASQASFDRGYAPIDYARSAAPAAAAESTLPVDAILAAGAAMPFEEAAKASPDEALARAIAHAEAVQGPAPPRNPADAGGTADVGAIFAAGTALPFAEKPAEPARRKPVRTLAVDASSVFPERMPFRSDAKSPEKALEDAIAHAEAVQGPAPAPGPAEAGATLDVGAIFAAGPALPFTAPPAQPAQPDLTLEQYASLCVELHLYPQRAAEVFARYRVSPESRAAVDACFQARIASDPAAKAAYARAYAAYRAYLTGSPQGRR